MKIINPILSGSVLASGSFVLPSGRANQRPSNPASGSLFFEISDSGSVLTVYNGSGSSGWETVGKQTTPVTPPVVASADIEYLLIAGGGGGGSYGGGGAGGYLSSSLSSVTSGSTFTVTVGTGGAGSGASYENPGVQGVDSSIAGASISTITALGGGYGGDNNEYPGADGGSGGGGSDGPTDATGGTGTVGQGNDGGAGTFSDPNYVGGGGGGAGTAGGDATLSPVAGGDGGNGLASSITGTSTTRGGGGGGVTWQNTGTAGSAGSGGGGAGGTWNANTANGSISNATAGTANTGGGGGCGNNGGSGVAIFAYPSASVNGAGGIVGDAGNGRKYHQFNASDTFKIGNTSDFQIVTDNLVLHLDAGDFASRGTSTWTDLSTNGVNQTVSSATLGENFYYTFNGSSDYITINQNGASTASSTAHTGYGSFTGAYNNPYTFEFWIKTTDSGGDATFGQPIVGDTLGDLYGQISLRSNKLSYSLYDGGWAYVESTTSINDGNWHHCVVVHYANQTVDLYVDNIKEANGSSLSLATTRYFKMLYLMRGYSTEYMSGDLAQLRLYDTTLTAAQVAQNYEATKTNFV